MFKSNNALPVHEIKDVFDKDDDVVELTIFDLLKTFCLQKIALQCGAKKNVDTLFTKF